MEITQAQKCEILEHELLNGAGLEEILIVYDSLLGELLEFSVVYICPVHSNGVSLAQMRGLEPERVVCGSRGELYV